MTPPEYPFSPVEHKRPSTSSSEDFYSPAKFLNSPDDEGIETTPPVFTIDEGMILPEGRGSLGLGTLQEKVQGIPPAFLKPLTKRRVFEGDSLQFCAEKAVRLVAVTDNETSEQGEKYVSINFDVFAEPSKDDKIEFKGKSTNTCSFQFQVTEIPPKCIIPLQNVTAAVGTPVMLQCLVSGKPNPTAEWYKDGAPVKNSRYIIQEKASGHFNLLITNVSHSDGSYLCKASNSVGTATCCAELRVVDKPNFVKSFEATTIAVGNPLPVFFLTCLFLANKSKLFFLHCILTLRTSSLC
uniref:Ig-like domain-containing protein n=1 Tax=Cyprinus carpio carpio TaxID=630221 RepID=A0A9J8BTN1_CYPCA